jgi:hypothetical protein
VTILAVTPYTGSERLVKMTESMLESFRLVVQHGLTGMDAPVDVAVVAINNAAVRPIKTPVTWHGHFDKNEGFGVAVNLAIKREVFDMQKHGQSAQHYSHVLVLNNDLEFPDPFWLRELLLAREGNLVLSPCTDVTATKVAVAASALDADPVRADQVSAFCWLVPVTTIVALRKKFGVELFHPEFTNYGSDDIAGSMLRKLLGPKPFKVVKRSFVRHLKAQTANELGVKAGTPELLLRMRNFKRARGLA